MMNINIETLPEVTAGSTLLELQLFQLHSAVGFEELQIKFKLNKKNGRSFITSTTLYRL
jgi:hypothetical protein